ncbi:hypothetical protein JOD24_001955 [Kroppenstedtia sanguinis]|uniref:Group II intron reverse transcriptase/maturase n=1 Tax=Kroppenstedtia sanguinis TaxID=1380684 RepID=A0ABW4CB44_9BACL
MQRAEVILSLLSRKARHDESFVFRRLYRNFFNPDFYRNAWIQIREWPGAQRSNVSLDGVQAEWVKQVIRQMKAEAYYPRSLGPKQGRGDEILPIGDRWVLEILRQILEAIYEPIFLNSSHGFRPGRSHQTALRMIRTSCRNVNWGMEGEIQDLLQRMDPQLLLSLLARRIDDGRFLELLHRFLRAGLLRYGGIPLYASTSFPGGEICSLLVNIYLHELDRWMEERSLSARDQGEQMIYLRYAERFLLCLSGKKATVQALREDIQTFLQSSLHLALEGEEIRIQHLAKNPVRFLGYEIQSEKRVPKQDATEVERGAAFGGVQLLVPGEVIRQQIGLFSQRGKPVHINSRIYLPLPQLIQRYHVEMRELYDFYSMAEDVSTKLGKFRYYHYWSLVKTIARKEKTSLKKVLDKYGTEIHSGPGTVPKKRIGLKVEDGDGREKLLTYFHEPLRKKMQPELVCTFGKRS